MNKPSNCSATVKRRSAAMTKEQRAWCKEYEKYTTFEPLMDDFLAGNESFVTAARYSVRWFEDWSNDAYLSIPDIPGVNE